MSTPTWESLSLDQTLALRQAANRQVPQALDR